MAQPPPQVLDLVERFDRNRDAYRSPHYNETQLRREFLDPALQGPRLGHGQRAGLRRGLQGRHPRGRHPKSASATKAPDYCFRIGGTRKFFLEAKKPSVDIKDDVEPRLSSSAATPGPPSSRSASSPTSRSSPSTTAASSPTTRRHRRHRPHPLHAPSPSTPSAGTEIAGIFSRDAVLKGSFDKFAESTKAKRGTAEVDDAFLQNIEDLARRTRPQPRPPQPQALPARTQLRRPAHH